MQALAVNCQHFGGRCNDWLEFVGQGPALFGVWLFQFVQNQDLGLKGITKLRRHGVVVQEATILQVRATDCPDERRPHGVLARALVTAMQDSVVDLCLRVLHLEGHDIKDVFQLVSVRH